jgi:hypothetical protein
MINIIAIEEVYILKESLAGFTTSMKRGFVKIVIYQKCYVIQDVFM